MMQFITDKVVKKYEFTYLLPEFFTSAEIEKTHIEIEKLIKKHGGKVISTDDWGKKSLAYKIKKRGKIHRAAFYTYLSVEFSPTRVQKFEKDFYLNEKVLRHLLVVEERESQPLKPESDVRTAKLTPKEKK